MEKVKKFFSFLIIIAIIVGVAVIYNKYNYNDFTKSVRQHDITVFSRDSEVKYSDMASYKIENPTYNDAMFSQVISVLPNTPYKVTCMVKVENVQNENNNKTGGAHICIKDTVQRSNTISGTSGWQQLTFLFNSKNERKVEIGFRLGGYNELSKGTAWFSDFKVEAGVSDSTTKWNMGCFIIPNIDVDVDINGKTEHVKLNMSNEDISKIKTNLSRFKTSISQISRNKINIDYKTITINEPIKTLSYDEENGYYVDEKDVYDLIDSYVKEYQFDHIYVVIRMADKQKGNDVLVNDWIGLGGMDYFGIGFSNIRMPDDTNNYAYTFDYRINTFPEEVFIHEFLHTLERNAKEYGLDRPELHDYEKYGYSEQRLEGLKDWYADYMNKEISYGGEKIGLPIEIYSYKPPNESDFKYAREIDVMKEPENIFEILNSLVSRLIKMLSRKEVVAE